MGLFNYSLPEDFDLSRLCKAWQVVAKSSPILRMPIVQNGTLFQVAVHEELPWTMVDNRTEYSASLTQREMQLGQPLVYLTHSQPRPGHRTNFLLAIHHVLYDGWSLPLVLDQVRQAYDRQSLSFQPFNGFIEYFVRSGFKSSQDYWIDQLAGVAGTVFPPLPSSDYRPVAHSTTMGTIPMQSPAGITKATLLHLAWSLTLSHYTDSNDVVFGLTRSGRHANVSGIESILGPTITTVPLRVRLQKEQSVISSLCQVQEQLTAMVPFEQLGLQNIRQLGPDAAAACDFQNLLVVQQSSVTSTNGSLLPIDRPGSAEAFSAYALEVTCETSAYETTISFDFDPKIIKPQQARRVLPCYTNLLQQMQMDPSRKVSDLNFLHPRARTEIMEWNAVLPKAFNLCIHNGIQQQCIETPDAAAICAWDGEFTYRELDNLSSSFALHLQSLAIGPEVFVPVCSEKSCSVAVAILGILKAGGTIDLLDPKIPLERLQNICQGVGARIVVTSINCAKMASQLARTLVTVGPDSFPRCQPYSHSVLPSQVSPRNALYATFTSGSTGKPKGIVIDHAAFYTNGRALQRHLYLDSKTRTFQFSSHMFDVSVEDYLWTFLTGGCLCIPSENGLKNKLPGVVKELHVNRIGMTPSLARMYRAEDIPTVKAIILGGEPLSRVDVQMWADKVRLVNSYGPTKCSVSCISTDMSAHSDPTNVGQMHGAAAWIVNKDDHDRLVSPGAPGELLLEGHTLARGYLGEPKKTAAAFVNSPQWLRELRPESRVYKTGDLVQYDVDRSIRYIGRKDTQVKIRGQRVELGETENQIHQASSSAVYDVIVELISTAGGRQTGPILAAFVRGSPTTAFGDDQEVVCKAKRSAMFGHGSPTQRAESQRIVQILAKRLPSYMVPSIFIPLTYVPVSPSGKADRRFLREQAAALSRQELGMYFTCNVTKRPPKTSSEQTLQAIVAEVLLLEANEVGMDDDFFQLGGDSIITTRLVLRAREASFSFRVTDVFRTPKLSDMASIRAGESIERATDTGLSSAHYLGFSGKDDTIGRDLSSRPCFFFKENVSDILPVTHFAEQMLFQSPEYWGDTLRGPIDYSRLQWACAELFQRHEILRTVFLPFRNQFVQVILDHFDTRIQHLGFMDSLDGFLDQHRREDQVSLRTIDKLVTRFTFVQGPQESGILVLRLSHAQFDGYSLRTLWHDLQYLYGGASLPPAANLSSHIQEWARKPSTSGKTFWLDPLQLESTTKRFVTTTSRTICPLASLNQRVVFIRAPPSRIPSQQPHSPRPHGPFSSRG